MPDPTRPMTPEEFAAEMRQIFPAAGYDEEEAHIAADKLMGNLLTALGYGAGVRIFRKAGKWYA